MAGASRHALRLAGWLLLAAPVIAWGLASDRSKPIQIEADRATLDEKAGISVYEGNVHLQQGTLVLRGERMSLEVHDNQVESITVDGTPASFSQRPDGADTDQHAEAGHIEYHTASQRLILQGDAVIRQSEKENFSSDRIVFNLKDNTVSAGGDSAGSRVRITLQPDTAPGETPEEAVQDTPPDGQAGAAE